MRVKKEYSQEYLAELLNVSRQAITKWESGNGMPDIDNLKAIADVFDVTLDSLMRDEEDIETTDDGFCWKFAIAGIAAGLSAGFLFLDFIGTGIAFWGLGGGVLGYVAGYIVLLLRRGKKQG